MHLYDELASQIARIRGCGIVRAETIAGSPQGTIGGGLTIVLRADTTLWMQIRNAGLHRYPAHLIDAIRILDSTAQPHYKAGKALPLTSEPVMLARATKSEFGGVQLINGTAIGYERAGITVDEQGTFQVPKLDVNAEWYLGGQRDMALAPAWAQHLLGSAQFYVEDNEGNPRGLPFVEFVVLPDREATVGDCALAVNATSPGWNFVDGMDKEMFATYANQLYANIAEAEPFGH